MTTVNAQGLLEVLRWPSALLVVLLAYPAILAWLGRRGLLRLPADGRAAALVRPHARAFLLRHRSTTIFIGMISVAALLPFIVTLPILNDFQRQNVWLTGFSYAGVFVLLAIGLNIVVGLAGLLDLGYAAFFAIGSYAYAFGASPFSHNHFPFLLMIVAGAVIAATFGVLLGAPTLRLRGDYLAIVTLGFGEIVPIVFLNAGEFTEGTNGIGGIYKPDLPLLETFSILNPWPFYLVMAVMIAVVMILVYKLERSRLGRAWMAVREDELAAAANGINTVTTKLLAFSLGASTSGFAGVFNASYLQIVSPDQFSFTVSFTVLAMIVLGGMGNIWGVAMGAFILYNIQVVLLHQLNTFFDNFHLPHPNFIEYQFLLFGLALVFMMLLRPEGLFPSQRRKRELHAAEDLEAAADLPGADELSSLDPSSSEVQL